MSSVIPFINYTKSSIKSLLKKYTKLPDNHILQIIAASHVYPFRANNYVVENLINWDNVPNDPIFRLTFPQPEMLLDDDMNTILNLMAESSDGTGINNRNKIRSEATKIRNKLNPHPAQQKEMNVPSIDMNDGKGPVRVPGVQHKYRETLLFFPSEAQWCHAYCTYCFRWAQFTEVGSEQQFKSKDISLLTKYIAENKQITDILFTGGDPAVMTTKHWEKYISPLIADETFSNYEHLDNIRIGTKSLTYWPYRYTNNEDSYDFLKLLEKISLSGKHVTIQAHFTHPQELSTKQVEESIRQLRMTGANIRSQAPIVKGINDSSKIWEEMWKKQVSLGIIPYYMFIERDTGPKHYFELPLLTAFNIFKEAQSKVSGIARTVRGPSMSCEPGKIGVVGVTDDAMILQFLQSRNPEWMKKTFFAKLDPNATWIDNLQPYGNAETFFYQQEFDNMGNIGLSSGQMNDNVIDQNLKSLKIDKVKPINSHVTHVSVPKLNGNHHINNGINGINGKSKNNHKVNNNINGNSKNDKNEKNKNVFVFEEKNLQKTSI